VQEYSSKIILCFQFQNHELGLWVTSTEGFGSWVTSTESKPIHLNQQCNVKVSFLINSTFFVNLSSYVLEYCNNIVSWYVSNHDM